MQTHPKKANRGTKLTAGDLRQARGGQKVKSGIKAGATTLIQKRWLPAN